MANGRVVLYDLSTGGHHVKYVRCPAYRLPESTDGVVFVLVLKAASITTGLAANFGLAEGKIRQAASVERRATCWPEEADIGKVIP